MVTAVAWSVSNSGVCCQGAALLLICMSPYCSAVALAAATISSRHYNASIALANSLFDRAFVTTVLTSTMLLQRVLPSHIHQTDCSSAALSAFIPYCVVAGKWTVQQAAEMSVAAPTIEASLDGRFVSGLKEERVKAAKFYEHFGVNAPSQLVSSCLNDTAVQ